MTNYQNGKIYKITGGGQTYYGSTTMTLAKRLIDHRSECKRKPDKKRCTSTQIMGLPDCKIELVEDYPCNSRRELVRREGWYQRNNECVNKNIAGRTPYEYLDDHKEKYGDYQKIYREANRDKTREWYKWRNSPLGILARSYF